MGQTMLAAALATHTDSPSGHPLCAKFRPLDAGSWPPGIYEVTF